MIYGWDEFVWGQFAKFIHQNGSFWIKSSAVLTSVIQYPPGAPIAQNIFMPFGNFNEAAIYIANVFPFLCLIILIISLVNKKKSKNGLKILKILTAILGTLFVYFYFGFNYHFPGYGSLDHTVGVIFAAGLLIVFSLSTKLKNLYLTLPIISVLILIKSSGLLLALIIGFIFFIRYLIKLLQEKKKILKNWKNMFLVLILLVLAFSPYFFWNEYIKKEKFEVNKALTTNLNTINNAFIIKNSKRYKTTWNNFYEYIFTKPFNYVGEPGAFPKMVVNQGTLINWTLALIVVCSLIIYLQKKDKNKIFKDLISYIILFTGLFGWILFHLFIWLIVFSEYEGTILSSYARYLSVFFMGIAILLFINLIKKIKGTRIIIILFIAIIFTANYFKSLFTILIKRPIYNFDPKRNETISIANNVKNIVKNTNRIYFIHQNSNGYEAMVFRYEMSPNNYIQDWGWSLGDKYGLEDVWTVPTNIEDLKSILSEYNYIVLDKIDENFIKNYGKLFNPKNKMDSIKLWKITKNNTNLVISPFTFNN